MGSKTITLIDGYREIGEVELICAFEITFPSFISEGILGVESPPSSSAQTGMSLPEFFKAINILSFRRFDFPS